MEKTYPIIQRPTQLQIAVANGRFDCQQRIGRPRDKGPLRPGRHTLQLQAHGSPSVATNPLLAVKTTVLQGYLGLSGSLNDGVCFSHPSLTVGQLSGGVWMDYPGYSQGEYIFPLI